MLPDSGRSYLSKFYDDNWMLQYGFLERKSPAPTIEEVLRFKRGEAHEVPDLVTIESNQKVGAAIDLMQRYSISQLPVVRSDGADSLADVIGSLQERGVLDRVFKNPDAMNEDVAVAMQPPLATVDVTDSLDQVFADLSGPSAAVVVAAAGRPAAILTRSDLLEYLAHQRSQVNGVEELSDVCGSVDLRPSRARPDLKTEPEDQGGAELVRPRMLRPGSARSIAIGTISGSTS